MGVRDLIAEHEPPRVSRSGQLRFAQYVRAVQNPGVLLDDLQRGVVEPEVLETWQALFPEGLAEVRQMLEDEISAQAADGAKFSQRQIRLFDEVLGTPDSSYTEMLQRNYRKAEEAGRGRGPSGGKGIHEQLPTGIDAAIRQ